MITIVWDVDDVLNDLMRCWLEQRWRTEHPECQVRFEEIKANPPERIIGATREEYLSSLDAFRSSKRYAEMEPDRRILMWFEKYGSRARHIALSAVPLGAAHVSAAWVMRHFGNWVRGFHFIPSKRSGVAAPEYDKSKQEFFKWFGKADVFIEDNADNVAGLDKTGVNCLLVSKPWNKSEDNIQQVLKKLTRMVGAD